MRLVCVLSVAAWLILLAPSAWSALLSFTELRLTLPFEAFEHRSVYVRPDTSGPHPTVLLLPGSGPVDVDTELYAHLARQLAGHGVASFRFDKRFVLPNLTPAQEGAAMLVGPLQHLDDAEAALRVLRERYGVAASCMFVYGHSEGSTAATALRERHPELAGLILHAPVTLDWAELTLVQLREVQLSALRAAVGRQLSSEALRAVLNRGAVTPSRHVAQLLVDPQAYAAGEVDIDDRLDIDGDGLLDLLDEVPSLLEKRVRAAFQDANPFYWYGSGRGLPSVTAQAASMEGRVLVLQGERDGWTPAAYLNVLEAAWRPEAVTATVHRYPELGHSLGRVASSFEDDSPVIDPLPVLDMATWMKDAPGCGGNAPVL